MGSHRHVGDEVDIQRLESLLCENKKVDPRDLALVFYGQTYRLAHIAVLVRHEAVQCVHWVCTKLYCGDGVQALHDSAGTMNTNKTAAYLYNNKHDYGVVFSNHWCLIADCGNSLRAQNRWCL